MAKKTKYPNEKYLDKEEQEIIEAYERGEYVSSPDSDRWKQILEEAARNYMGKDARINIRISTSDLSMLKIRAAEEGMPYQTLIASVLHKFVSGRLSAT
jgi:predicted DNA binding CopG/RHH family protein